MNYRRSLYTLLFWMGLVTFLSFHLTMAAAASPKASPKVSPSPSAATDSAEIDPQVITDSIKKRIQEVIRNQAASGEKKVAFTGTISTITTNSVTLETAQGVQQASTSATLTKYVDVNTSKDINVEEVSIGDYVSALGFLPENGKVLDARRVLVLRTPPPTPSLTVFYGRIITLDKKKNVITIANSKLNISKKLTASAKSEYLIADTVNHKQDLTFKDLNLDALVLAIYVPDDLADDTGKLVSLTVKSDQTLSAKLGSVIPPSPNPALPTPQPKITPKP